MSRGRELSESCFEFLHVELVEYILRTTENNTEAIASKLDMIGNRVGEKLIERYSKDRPRFQDNLETVKYVCKDFWLAVFKKQVDNLRTNHRGIYVLQDNRSRWLQHLSFPDGKQDKEVMLRYTAFFCGLIRGALTNLGLKCYVTAEVPSLPSCTFTVKLST